MATARQFVDEVQGVLNQKRLSPNGVQNFGIPLVGGPSVQSSATLTRNAEVTEDLGATNASIQTNRPTNAAIAPRQNQPNTAPATPFSLIGFGSPVGKGLAAKYGACDVVVVDDTAMVASGITSTEFRNILLPAIRNGLFAGGVSELSILFATNGAAITYTFDPADLSTLGGRKVDYNKLRFEKFELEDAGALTVAFSTTAARANDIEVVGATITETSDTVPSSLFSGDGTLYLKDGGAVLQADATSAVFAAATMAIQGDGTSTLELQHQVAGGVPGGSAIVLKGDYLAVTCALAQTYYWSAQGASVEDFTAPLGDFDFLTLGEALKLNNTIISSAVNVNITIEAGLDTPSVFDNVNVTTTTEIVFTAESPFALARTYFTTPNTTFTAAAGAEGSTADEFEITGDVAFSLNINLTWNRVVVTGDATYTNPAGGANWTLTEASLTGSFTLVGGGTAPASIKVKGGVVTGGGGATGAFTATTSITFENTTIDYPTQTFAAPTFIATGSTFNGGGTANTITSPNVNITLSTFTTNDMAIDSDVADTGVFKLSASNVDGLTLTVGGGAAFNLATVVNNAGLNGGAVPATVGGGGSAKATGADGANVPAASFT